MVATLILTRTFAIAALFFGALPAVFAAPIASSGLQIKNVLEEIAARDCRGSDGCLRRALDDMGVGGPLAAIIYLKVREVDERGCGEEMTSCYREIAESVEIEERGCGEEMTSCNREIAESVEIEERGCGEAMTSCYREIAESVEIEELA